MKNAKEFLMSIQKNKKNDNNGTISNSILEDRKNLLDLNIAVGVDVSGSISSAQFSMFMAQLDAIKGLSRVKVIEVDTQIVAMYDYYVVKRNLITRISGGGGTAFAGAFNTLKKLKPDAILFMTDGYVSDNVSNPGIPTGWILTPGGRKPYDFGFVLDNIQKKYKKTI